MKVEAATEKISMSSIQPLRIFPVTTPSTMLNTANHLSMGTPNSIIYQALRHMQIMPATLLSKATLQGRTIAFNNSKWWWITWTLTLRVSMRHSAESKEVSRSSKTLEEWQGIIWRYRNRKTSQMMKMRTAKMKSPTAKSSLTKDKRKPKESWSINKRSLTSQLPSRSSFRALALGSFRRH